MSLPLEQEHLGWSKEIHVVGHSMGAMIATRLAALAPGKMASLTMISTTSGGLQIIPRSWRAVKYALQVEFPEMWICNPGPNPKDHLLAASISIAVSMSRNGGPRSDPAAEALLLCHGGGSEVLDLTGLWVACC